MQWTIYTPKTASFPHYGLTCTRITCSSIRLTYGSWAPEIISRSSCTWGMPFFVWRLRNAWIPLFFVARLNIYPSYFFFWKWQSFQHRRQETGTTLQRWTEILFCFTHGDFTAKTGAKRALFFWIYPRSPARWVPTILINGVNYYPINGGLKWVVLRL